MKIDCSLCSLTVLGRVFTEAFCLLLQWGKGNVPLCRQSTLLSLSRLGGNATVTWGSFSGVRLCVSKMPQPWNSDLHYCVVPKSIISEWFHYLKTKHPGELKAQCFHRHLLFIRAQNGENVTQRFSLYSGPTQGWSHSAQAWNNPQSWTDTSCIASSEAGGHAENLLFAFMGISITEAFTLCSKDRVKSVLHWLQKEELKQLNM